MQNPKIDPKINPVPPTPTISDRSRLENRFYRDKTDEIKIAYKKQKNYYFLKQKDNIPNNKM